MAEADAKVEEEEVEVVGAEVAEIEVEEVEELKEEEVEELKEEKELEVEVGRGVSFACGANSWRIRKF
jgi:hypothetical protein